MHRRNSRASFCGFMVAHRKVCSQIRNTLQPALRNVRVTSASRFLFAESFRCQNARLFFGCVACLGQPCQKQPSTNIAVRDLWKTKSGRTASREPRVEGREPEREAASPPWGEGGRRPDEVSNNSKGERATVRLFHFTHQ